MSYVIEFSAPLFDIYPFIVANSARIHTAINNSNSYRSSSNIGNRNSNDDRAQQTQQQLTAKTANHDLTMTS